ncbi:hypothetical protein [Apilactobacillus xinyiensis]|uniref:hypothetical protein n=1 Tax=Apilactobacillus xinyiensis TaxID=2841032 RepID=UPI00200FF685|nr:hypothetical protein [Apilactobacillus xinyiensis]MCL0330675.1 hypothetical protein [Apilactobacillus xinyiensis]
MIFKKFFSNVKIKKHKNEKTIDDILKSINNGEKLQDSMQKDYQKHKKHNEKILSMFK